MATRLESFLSKASRAFLPGPAVHDDSVFHWGLDNTEFSPPEYGEYIATSNAVYVCSNLRATLVSSVPIRFYTVNDKGEKKDVTSGEVIELFTKVNPFWTARRLFQMSIHHLDLWGSTFWFYGKKGNRPAELWPIRPDLVTVVPHRDNYISHFLYKPKGGLSELKLDPSEVFWARFPNPMDEYSGLAPVAAARLAADTQNLAMKTNRSLFNNGAMVSGFITPSSDEDTWTKKQAEDLEADISKRFRGVKQAHKVAVLREAIKYQAMSMSPKDAEFLGMSKWNLEDVARAFGVPLDLVGGQRTFENVAASERLIWNHTIKHLCSFLADEITEQILPFFPGNLLAEFDLSEVDALKDDEQVKWNIAASQLDKMTLTINEYRKDVGLDPVFWGDVPWANVSVRPISEEVLEELVNPPEPEPLLEGEPEDETGEGSEEAGEGAEEGQSAGGEEPAFDATGQQAAVPIPTRMAGITPLRPTAIPESGSRPRSAGKGAAIDQRFRYGSAEHKRLVRTYEARTNHLEQSWERKLQTLFNRQKQSVLTRLKAGTRNVEETLLEPFDRAQWTKQFRLEGRALAAESVVAGGTDAATDIGLSFRVNDPKVQQFIEQRAQRFSTRVNETTYKNLVEELSEGTKAGESIDKLAGRVDKVFAERKSSAQTIARTEAIGAYNGGTLASWEQTGVVEGKTWLASLDARCRATHVEAHGQVVALRDPFGLVLDSDLLPVRLELPERT